MPLIGNGIKSKKTGKSGLNNRIYQPFYGISKNMQNLDFVGLENYLNLFNDRGMKDALKNTCLYAVVFPVIVTLFAIPLSLVLNSKMRTRNLQRAVFFFPSVPSAIILGYLWMYLLSPTNTGIINKFLGWFHIKPVLWLADPQWAMFSIILVGVWSAVGWHACIYLAQLQSIPGEYYEAATIDGAGAWQKFRYITFPMLSSAMTVSVMLLLVNVLKIYDLPFALTKGGPGTSTTMISQIIIKVGFVEKNYGKATAMSAVFFIPFYYLLVNTFKSSQEATFSPMSLLIRSFTLEHYAEAFASSNFLRSFVNSLLITVISVIIIIVFGSMAAYVIARRQNRLTKLLFLYFLLGFMVPAQTTLIPLFELLSGMGLQNSRIGLVFLYSSWCGFALFMYQGFIGVYQRIWKRRQ